MSDYPMLISNKLHSFRNFRIAKLQKLFDMSNISSLKARTSKNIVLS